MAMIDSTCVSANKHGATGKTGGSGEAGPSGCIVGLPVGNVTTGFTRCVDVALNLKDMAVEGAHCRSLVPSV